MLRSTGTGIGRFTATTERLEREEIIKNYVKRVEKLGKFPGTHTLGAEFRSKK